MELSGTVFSDTDIQDCGEAEGQNLEFGII